MFNLSLARKLIVRQKNNQQEQALKQRDRGYWFSPTGIQTMDNKSALEFAESMVDACHKSEEKDKDYVVEVTKKGTWYSAPYDGEDTSGVVILRSIKMKEDSEEDDKSSNIIDF